MPHRLSASRRRLGRRCLYWARGDVALPLEDHAGAAVGNATHDVAADEGEGLEWALKSADLDAVSGKWTLSEKQRTLLEALRASWLAWWAEFSNGLPWETETPFAFETASGAARRLPKGEHRDYSDCAETEIPGTADADVLVGGGAIVVDLKTGKPPKRAQDHIEQLLFVAICLRAMHGIEKARLVIAHVTPEDVRPDWIDVDAFDLDTAAAELRGELAGLDGAEPQPGAHCSKLFCPLLPSCPATTRHLIEGLPMTGPIADAAALERYLDVLPRIEAWADERKRACRAMLDEAGGRIELPSGRLYRLTQEQRESPRLDVPGAEKALYDVLGTFADDAIERKTSKTAIEAAARKKLQLEGGAKRGELARLKSEAIESLRRVGAIKVSKFVVPEVKESPTT